MFTNNFDPVAIQILSLEIRWYSLAYIAGIVLGWIYCKKVLIKDDKFQASGEFQGIGSLGQAIVDGKEYYSGSLFLNED